MSQITETITQSFVAGIYDVEPSNTHYFNGGMIEKISQEGRITRLLF